MKALDRIAGKMFYYLIVLSTHHAQTLVMKALRLQHKYMGEALKNFEFQCDISSELVSTGKAKRMLDELGLVGLLAKNLRDAKEGTPDPEIVDLTMKHLDKLIEDLDLPSCEEVADRTAAAVIRGINRAMLDPRS